VACGRHQAKASQEAALAATFTRAETFAAALASELARCAAIHAVMARELAAT
jgi:hypothetical protein